MPSKKTQNQLIEEFHEVHGNYYDYSLVKYVNSSTKIKVVCPAHGEFQITPSHHKKGVGCRKCYFASQKISKEDFIHRSEKHFGKRYDYSFVSELPQNGNQIKILCREHSRIFLQDPKNHMRGHTGCPECVSLMLSGTQEKKGKIKTNEDLTVVFIERARAVHDSKYDYSEFEYLGSNKKGKILCLKHGAFWQSPSNHLRGSNCPSCSREHQGKNTFKSKCQELGVDYWRALKRRKAGLSEEVIFNQEYVRSLREVGEITVFGFKYPNLKEAVRCLKPQASAHTIARWIREGMLPEEAFSRTPNPGYAQGMIYLVTHKCSGKQYVGLTIQSLERRWQDHIEQALAGHIKGNESLHNAIREYGSDAFEIFQIDQGTSKQDLERKEKEWIKKLKTLVPDGYNISTGGVSGGSNKKTTYIDGICFESVREAAIYLSQTRSISFSAAKKRISQNKINVNTPAKPGESLIKTKAYKAWSRIIHGALNPKSKEYIPGLNIYPAWRNFKQFLQDVGNPPEDGMAFSRLDKDQGFFPDNCAWLTKSEASMINAEYMKQKGRLGRNSRK